MICIGSFKSLESLLDKPQFTGAPCEVRTWVGSDNTRDRAVENDGTTIIH